ncbi:MAG: hypothetical protein A2516_03825 [Alphaproteobacteria bacterium RIFOXYD12_FULL_60_8]|nr:MAG: hypothetical protein A2516_03825 [Alphaproteobacteria bacterium RIFOXYD12_FULL_60_8]
MTKTLKARYSQPQFKPQQRNAPIHALSLAENLALGVTSQSVACPEADEVGAEILQGLYDVRNDLKDNPVIDPQSYAAAILDLYLVSLAKLFQTHGVTAKVRKAPGASSHEEFRILRERTPASDQPVNLRVVTPNAA